MDLGLNGKRALVCGASKGIGNAIARELAKEGVELLLVARDQSKLDQACSEIKGIASNKVHSFAADLSSHSDRDGLVAAANANMGGVDILIHNVGGPKPSFTSETTLEEWQKGFDQLFLSVAHLNQAFLPGMKEKNWGRIITVTSLSVQEPIKTLAVSNAIRSAVVSMLKSLADEVASYNITVNCIAPGMIQTDRLDQLMEARIKRSGQTKEEYDKQTLSSIPAGRLGKPEEFAAMATFLCSQRASYVTGSTVAVDGGKRRSTY